MQPRLEAAIKLHLYKVCNKCSHSKIGEEIIPAVSGKNGFIGILCKTP